MNHTKYGAKMKAYPIISTGSLKLDIALGTGGYPLGSIIEISGKISSGKTALALHGIKETQRSNRSVALIDADRALDVGFARRIGVRIDSLYFSEPDSTEQALWTIEMLAQSSAFGMIVLDSIPGLTPANWDSDNGLEKLEIDNDELISDSLLRLSRIVSRTGTIIIFLNDFDQKMSAVYHNLSSNPRRITLKLLADIRVRLSSLEPIKIKREIIGEKIQAQIMKNKYFPLLNPTDFDIIYEQGINKSAEIFTLGIHTRLIQKQSAGFFYQTIYLGKASSDAIHFLEGNKQIQEDAEENIRRAFLPENFNAAT
jgi:recombination protein RecA